MTEAIILAGGLGSRLRTVVNDVPKPMADVAGRPFLAHQMQYWANQGVSHFVLSVGYKWEVIRDYFEEDFEGVPVSYAVEQELAGTGGAVQMAAGNLEEDEPFLVLNGDTYCNASLDAIRQHHQQHEADITMVVKAVDLTDRYGLVELGSDQRIKAFHSREESGQDGGLINTGIYLVEVPVIGVFRLNPSGKTSLESDIFPALLEYRVLSAYRTGAEFIDIGIPEDYARCAQVIAGIQMHN